MSDYEVVTAYALAGIGAVALWEAARFLLRPANAGTQADRNLRAEHAALKRTVRGVAMILQARQQNRAAALRRDAERRTIEGECRVIEGLNDWITPDSIRGEDKVAQFRAEGRF